MTSKLERHRKSQLMIEDAKGDSMTCCVARPWGSDGVLIVITGCVGEMTLNADDATALHRWLGEELDERKRVDALGEMSKKPYTPRLDRRTERHVTDHLRTIPDGRVLFFDHEVRGNTMFVFQVLAELHDVDSAKKMYDVMENWEPEDVE